MVTDAGGEAAAAGYVVSAVQARPLLAARRSGQDVATTSLDLGLTTLDLALTTAGVALPDGTTLTWERVERIHAAPKDALAAPCFRLEQGIPHRLHTFSETTQRPLSLVATRGAPTLLLAGFYDAPHQEHRSAAGHAGQAPQLNAGGGPRAGHDDRPSATRLSARRARRRRC